IGWWFIREPLWILMAVILFTPSRVNPMEPWQAPAFIGWLLETLLGTGGDTAALLAQLALVGSLAMVAYRGFVCLRLGWRHWRGGRTAARMAEALLALARHHHARQAHAVLRHLVGLAVRDVGRDQHVLHALDGRRHRAV